MKKIVFILSFFLLSITVIFAQPKVLPGRTSVTVHENLSYKADNNLSQYEKERCKLDLYLPDGIKDFPVMVWFHGGSLKHGSKEDEYTRAVGKTFAGAGIGTAIVNYRLSPNVKYPAYIDDAAAAIAWIYNNIASYGGNPSSIFISGHSAGGYLVYMLVMNLEFLQKYQVNSMDLAGVIPISGQTFTHSTIREERGISNPEKTPMINEGSPCYHAQKVTPPLLVICADGDSPDRIEENNYLLAFLKTIGNLNHTYKEINDRNHMTLMTKIPEKDDPLTAEVLMFIYKNKSKY